MEHKRASRWYLWLWLSPFLTVPTLAFILFNDPGYFFLYGGDYRGCDHTTRFLVSGTIAVLGSSLWHLVLLAPTSDKRTAFVRAHGRQALLLTGLRTLVPLAFLLFSAGNESVMLWIFPVLIMVWLIGTSVGQTQAGRGDCSLLRWLGDSATLETVQREIAEASQKDRLDPEKLVHIIRFNKDPQARKRALQVIDRREQVCTQTLGTLKIQNKISAEGPATATETAHQG